MSGWRTRRPLRENGRPGCLRSLDLGRLRLHDGASTFLRRGGVRSFPRLGVGWGAPPNGKVAVTAQGDPVLLDTSTPTSADPAIAWSGGVGTRVKSDVSFKTILGRDSGEIFQILFEGPGWVLIQPSEGPTVPPHTHPQQGRPDGFR